MSLASSAKKICTQDVHKAARQTKLQLHTHTMPLTVNVLENIHTYSIFPEINYKEICIVPLKNSTVGGIMHHT